MDKELLKQDLIRDEGLKLFPYKDSLGIFTAAVGRNLEGKGLSKEELSSLGINPNSTKQQVVSILLERGLTKQECLMLLDNDIEEVWEQLTDALPWIIDKPDVVQRVLANLCFNLGLAGLLQFKKTLSFLKADRWKEASEEMINSKWANQTGQRAIRLSNAIKSLSE